MGGERTDRHGRRVFHCVFVHGLAVPSVADGCNALVRNHLLHHLGRDDAVVKAINYSSLLHDNQTKRLSRISETRSPLQRSGTMNVTEPPVSRKPVDVGGILRRVPHHFLHKGLSFWGDKTFRENVFHLIQTTISSFERPSHGVLVLMGYSMGSTMLMEYLDEVGVSSLANYEKVFVFTIGSALNWHFQTRRLSFDRQKAHHTQPITWINVRYATDVLASGAWNRNPIFECETEDICFDVFGGCLQIIQKEEKKRSRWLSCLRFLVYCFREYFTMWKRIFDAVRWNLSYLKYSEEIKGTKKWTPRLIRAIINVSAATILRWLPVSHASYFHDDLVWDKIATKLKEFDGRPHRAIEIRSEKVQKDLTGFENADVVRAVSSTKLTPSVVVNSSESNSKKRFIYIYLHGMSGSKEVQKEWNILKKNLEKARKRHHVNESVEVFGISYTSLLEPQRAIQEALLHNTDEWVLDPYRGMKTIVLTQFPVAMAFWTEKPFRDAVIEGFVEQLSTIISQSLQQDSGSETHVVLVGYATGCLVALLGLGKYQKLFGSKSASNVTIDGIITLGCTLSWFGNIDEMVAMGALPQFSAGSLGWVNLWYSSDMFAAPLRKEHEWADENVKDIMLKNFNPLEGKGVVKSVFDSVKVLAWKAVLWCGFELPGGEVGACVNGLYLEDSAFWEVLMARAAV